jgi:pyruvate dehydrogenase E2 component (dihydrolipoamide acetyltransferase)
MAFEFRLPDLGEGLTEGEVARWLVAEGDEIKEDDPLVEIQTDKTTVEIPSPASGRVATILVGEGVPVAVGTVLVVIGDGEAATPRAEHRHIPQPTPHVRDRADSLPGGRPRATPLVRRIATQLGVPIESVRGTGPDGRITEEDVRRTAGESEPRAGERRERLHGVRRRIADNLARAHREVAAVTYVEECDFGGLDLSVLVPTVLRATALSLKEFPELNARLDGEEIVFLERYDLGLAVQTDLGLVVPVVRDCDSRSIEELGAEAARLAEAARSGTLRPEELRGSTFTVTSAGKLGGLFVTPLVNHPEVGILGVHRIGSRPVVRDDEVVVRPVGNISVTFDHRVVDGARAAAFCLDVIGRLQTVPGTVS